MFPAYIKKTHFTNLYWKYILRSTDEPEPVGDDEDSEEEDDDTDAVDGHLTKVEIEDDDDSFLAKALSRNAQCWKHALVEQAWCTTFYVDCSWWLPQSLLVSHVVWNISFYNDGKSVVDISANLETTSAFHAGPVSRSNWNLETLAFCGGRKTENPGKNLQRN